LATEREGRRKENIKEINFMITRQRKAKKKREKGGRRRRRGGGKRERTRVEVVESMADFVDDSLGFLEVSVFLNDSIVRDRRYLQRERKRVHLRIPLRRSIECDFRCLRGW
jgi:hypothetical protein